MTKKKKALLLGLVLTGIFAALDVVYDIELPAGLAEVLTEQLVNLL